MTKVPFKRVNDRLFGLASSGMFVMYPLLVYPQCFVGITLKGQVLGCVLYKKKKKKKR